MAVVQKIPSGFIGFDTDAKLTADLAKQFQGIGYIFAVRYLSLSANSDPGDIDRDEVQAILDSGLGFMPVQHVRYPGWVPTPEMGIRDGSIASSNAISASLPSGINVWLDLEGIAPGTDAQAIIDYCTGWYSQLSSSGYIPGLYEGADCILTSDQLWNLPFKHYWKSASNVPEVPNRGYCMVQELYQYPVFGISIDRNTVTVDNLGGLPFMLIADNQDEVVQAINNVFEGATSQLKSLNTKMVQSLTSLRG